MFETERYFLTRFQESDFKDGLNLFTNPKVRKYLGGVQNPDFIRATLDAMLAPEDGSFYWVIREKSIGEFIGLVSLDPHHDGICKEVSYQLLPNWWSRGFATETVTAILDFAMNDLQLPKLVAETQSSNQPSCNLLVKLGMTLERKVSRYGAEQSIYSIQSH
ncbi:GNAT family N-acetyltransferase [Metaplanococcus flavidus]|uniref:GNAT family N-acetyltransferase n=1 Tax=Metaplanococcus flavidus TaxID=569883 RepID=A0ABW3LAF5_9BACL